MRILIATPLESELAATIAGVDPNNEVAYVPELVPPPRYPCDHRGDPAWSRDAAGTRRWNGLLAQSDVLLGIPNESGDALAEALALAPRVRWVQCMFAGSGEQVRAARLAAGTLARIIFTSAAGVHATMLAEFVFLGLLALRKDLRRLEAVRAARSWPHFPTGELAGSRMCIVGMGGIGTAVARAARAFGMHVAAVTRDGRAHPAADEAFTIVGLRDAVAAADSVVVTLPGTAQTIGLISAEVIAAMRREAIFCNVGRGTVVDQAALVDALSAGRIAGAVLDVFDPEPLPPDNPLWTLENVVFAPHTMAYSTRENERVVDLFCDNLRRFASNAPLRNRIDPVEFY